MVGTESDGGGLRELIDEFSRVLFEPDQARELALRAGFPPAALPAFGTSRVFWSQVLRAADSGVMQGGIDAVVGQAAKDFPTNYLFTTWVTRPETSPRPPRPTLASDELARRPKTVPITESGETRIVVVSYGLGEQEANNLGDSAHLCSLEIEVALTRAAVLYSDRVGLISVGHSFASMVEDNVAAPSSHPKKFIDFLEKLFPSGAFPPVWAKASEAKRRYERALDPRTRRRAHRELVQLVRDLEKNVRQTFGADVMELLVDTSRFAELSDAKSKGLLEIETIPGVDPSSLGRMLGDIFGGAVRALTTNSEPEPSDSLPNFISPLARRLRDVVADPRSYPILDAEARSLLHNARDQIGELARRRSRVAGMAAHVMGQLPMPNLAIADLCELRHQAADQLGAFQVCIAEFSDEIQSAQWEPTFEEEARHIYATRIAPLVGDLDRKIQAFECDQSGSRRHRSASTQALMASTGLTLMMGTSATVMSSWLDGVLLATASLPVAAATFLRRRAQLVYDTIERELGRLQGNKLYYYANIKNRLESYQS